MLKKLFDFKLSKHLLIAKIIMLVCLAAAIVIIAMGLKEIVNVAHMKEILGMAKNAKLVMKDVLVYLLKNYVSWAALIAVIGSGAFLGTRYHENNKQA